MDLIQISLASSILLCSLVTGILAGFTIVVMPGIKTLNDHDFLKAFKVMDRVIQNNQPIFILLWIGSVLSVLVLTVISFLRLADIDLMLAIAATTIYLFGVQLPTATINVPLNNQLQRQDLDTLTESSLQEVREAFEPRWVRWNTIRTVFATLSSVLLILLIIRL
ncbi:MAG: DUF1772 domain-containing protein [Rhodothermales bacterium]